MARLDAATAKMSLMPHFIGRAIGLLRLAQPPAWASLAIVALGLTSAFLEGFTLSLFIPLIQSLGAAQSGGDQIGHLFNNLLEPVPVDSRIPILVAAVFLTVILKNLVGYLNTFMTRFTGGLVAHQLRLRVFEQTLWSCVDYRVQNKRTDIVNTLTTETWKVSNGLILVYRLAICACSFTVFCLLLLLISAKLTALAMLFLGCSAAAVHFATRRATGVGRSVVAENKRFGLRMWENIGALQLIRSFAREAYEQDRFKVLSESLYRRMLKMDMLWAVPGPLSEVFATALIGLLILAGATIGASFAVLAAFLAVLYRMQAPVREIMSSKVAIETLSASVADVAEFLEATSKPYIRSGTKPIAAFEREIAFRNVSFRYAPNEPLALNQVSFTIPKGRTTAIVGRSGAGKTTLMTLLYRFEDPTTGEILVDGTPLTEFDLRDWRRRLSLMSQEVRLFNETVEANIGYGNLDAPPEQVHRAAQIAGADAFIRDLPEGYATELGDHGMRLSGGQRQRIALARTILKDPDILLLDEATNALDSESEHAIQQALDTYTHGRTVVVIAHRLATVANADQVIVLDGGRVVECGPPATLLRNEGQFARLHDLQFGKIAARG
jgi:ATP-binding cassette, subfamily B, bacterial MsbA